MVQPPCVRQFESDKRSGAAKTPPGLSFDFNADFLDFEWVRSTVKKYARKGANNNMMNSNREKKRILLVEDQEDAREIVAFNLEEYTLIRACDFAEGLRLARRGYFDLYILDNWIPGRSGLELCRRIREFDPHTPILFYSACAYPNDLQVAFSAGAQEYLVKPVRFDAMTQVVTDSAQSKPSTQKVGRLTRLFAVVKCDLPISH
jgi:CheY-like chemotaxis protein